MNCRYDGDGATTGSAVGYDIICWKEEFCVSSPADVCSVHYSNDRDHAQLWEESYISMQGCNDTDGIFLEYDVPPCVCDYGDTASPTVCDNDSIGDGPDGIPDGYPDADDSGGDPTTGGPSVQAFVCSDAAQSKCLEIWYVNGNSPWQEECWIDYALDDAVLPCVWTDAVENAEKPCEDRCVAFRTAMMMQVQTWNEDHPDPDDQRVLKDSSGMVFDMMSDPDCDLGQAGDQPRLMTAVDVCEFNETHLKVWGGTSTLAPVRASVALTTTSGGSTGNSDILGYLGYEITNCSNGVCNIKIDALEGLKGDFSGVLTDASGAQTSYLIEGLEFQLVQVVPGQWHQSRGVLTFSERPFVGTVSAAGHTIAGLPLGPWETTAVVSQAVGSLTGTRLTLNLTLNLPDGLFTIAFQTM